LDKKCNKGELNLKNLISKYNLRNINIRFGLVVLFLFIQIPMCFFNPSEGDSFRFSQTTIVIREFMTHGIDVRVPLPLFGSNSFVPFEFPTYQILSSQIGNLFGLSPIFAARITSLLFFLISMFFTFKIAQRLFDHNTARNVLVFYLFIPFGMRYSHSPLIEFTAVSFMLIAFYLILESIYINNNKKYIYIFLSGLATIIGFLTKVTTAVALSPLFLIVVHLAIKELKFPRKVISILLLPSFSFLLSLFIVSYWNNYADRVKKNNVFTSHLISTSPQMRDWNFGTVKNRFEIESWVTILLHYFGPISAGIFSLLILAFVAQYQFNKYLILNLLGTLFFPILIFFNLYKNHQYYVAAIYPIAILVMSAGVVSICNRVKFNSINLNWILISLIIFSSYSTRNGVNYISDMFNHSSPPKLVNEIESNVPKGSYLMYLGCDWNPEIPYYVDSPTLMVPDWGIMPSEQDLDKIEYLVFCDYFPQDRVSSLNKYFSGKAGKVSDNIYEVYR